MRRQTVLLACLAVLLLVVVSLAVPPSADLLARGAVVSVRVTDRAGVLLQEVRPDGRGQPVTLDTDPTDGRAPNAISPHVVAALVATEDRRFYDHHGLDLRAVARAARDNVRAGHVVSGASTIPMQVASFLRADGGSTRTGLLGKLAEAHLALRLDAHLSKDEILALWLERAPFGNRAFGIEAAARTYFGKPASALTLPEAALLVGLPQRPSATHPFRYPDAARARQQRVLAAMEATGAITDAQRAQAAAVALDFTPRQDVFVAPHFVRAVTTPRALGLSPSCARRTDRVDLERSGCPPDRGVSTIRTTLDADLQAHLTTVARAHLSRLANFQVGNAALVVLENRTGHVLAYLGSADFWDAAALGQNDGVRMRRQPGSTVKPFTYAQALATRRYTPASILADIELEIAEAGGAFVPENYDRQYHGPVPLREALASSYNVPAVRLAHELGPAGVLDTYRRAGLISLTRDASHYGVGLTLGNGEVSLLELAQAYAGLANGGPRPALRPITHAVATDGDTLHWPLPSFEPGPVPADVAYLVTDILRDPAARAPGFGRGSALEVPFPVAVKTGTSKDYRDNWAVGYSPTHTVAAWAGNFDGTPMRWVSGVSGAAPLLRAAFEALAAYRGTGGDFARPAGIAEALVCPASGVRPGPACPGARREVFLEGTVPTDTCTVHRHVRLDSRTGLLADAGTPAEAVETRLFVVHPPEYHAWMAAHGLPLPPTVSRAALDATPDTVRTSDRLRVQFPEDGAVFALDPVLRRDYQRLALRAAIEEGLHNVTWWLDGEALPGRCTGAEWPLAPGRHTLELRAVTGEGQRLRSRPVTFTVVDAPPPVEATRVR